MVDLPLAPDNDHGIPLVMAWIHADRHSARRFLADLDLVRGPPVRKETLPAAAPVPDAWIEGDTVAMLRAVVFPGSAAGFISPRWESRLNTAARRIDERIAAGPVATEPYQSRVREWILHCFGPAIAADKVERNHRFLEEALELVQSGGCTASEAHQLVDYVFGRPVGEITQEVGGVMNTLAALCNAHAIDLNDAADTELERCWGKSEQIRAKQAAKPKHGPLPVAGPVVAQGPVWTAEKAALLSRMSEILEGHARRDDTAAELNRLRREAFKPDQPKPETPPVLSRCLSRPPCVTECAEVDRCAHAGGVR